MNVKITGVVVGAGLCVSLVLSGCGSSSSNSAATSAAPATSSASSSSPAPSTSGSASGSSGAVSAQAQQYLGLTAATNSDLTAFLALPDATSVSTAKAAAAKVVADQTTLLAKLKQAQWPSGVAATITAFESATAAVIPVYAAAAKDASVNAIKATLKAGQAKILAQSSAAAQVRAAVGLPVQGAPSASAGSASASATA